MDLIKLVTDESLDSLKGFVVGEAEDLQQWGTIIAEDAVRAVQAGRYDILSELREQVKVVAEMKRIKTQGFAWDQVLNIFLKVAKIAVHAMELKG